MKRLYTYIDPKTGENASLISKEAYGVINKHAALLDSLLFMIEILATTISGLEL